MFKVICDKCGEEMTPQKSIKVYEWTIDIVCECGNSLRDWYNKSDYGEEEQIRTDGEGNILPPKISKYRSGFKEQVDEALSEPPLVKKIWENYVDKWYDKLSERG